MFLAVVWNVSDLRACSRQKTGELVAGQELDMRRKLKATNLLMKGDAHGGFPSRLVTDTVTFPVDDITITFQEMIKSVVLGKNRIGGMGRGHTQISRSGRQIKGQGLSLWCREG